MSKLKFPLRLSILAALLCISTAGHADINIGAGAKFGWDNYKRAVMDYSVYEIMSTPNAEADTNPQALYGWGGYKQDDYPSPRFGGNLQLVINRRIVTMLELEFGTFKHTIYPYPYGATDEDLGAIAEVSQKFMKIGIGLEGKFFLTKPVDKKASPYVFIGLGKYFAKAKSPYADGTLASTKMISKLASPFYMNLGFGAEFFINESFSLGADIFGFRFETAKASAGRGLEGENPYYTGDQTLMNFYMYTALTLNFTFVKDPSAEPAQPSSDVWGTNANTQNNTGWGNNAGTDASGGWGAAGTADTSGGWGTPAAAPVNNNSGWGTPAAPAQPAAPANNNTWGTPAAQPVPAQPARPEPAPEHDKPKAKKKKKASTSINVGGGGGAAPPPPAP